MPTPKSELREVWRVLDGKVIAEGDSAIIKDWLATKLDQVAVDWSGWITLYRHRGTGQFWELSYPNGEMHGGGPRLLRHLQINDPGEWKTSPQTAP